MGGLYQKTYELNQWEQHPELWKSQISIEEVLGTQAVLMQLLQNQPRSVFHRDKRHGFALVNTMDSQQDELYDGSTEEYMAGMAPKYNTISGKCAFAFAKMS